MSAVNEGFVGDDDIKESNAVVTRTDGPPSAEIDYSKARKGTLIAAALSATIGAFILGSLLGWASPVQPQLQQLNNSFVNIKDNSSVWYIEIDDAQMSWVGSLVNMGALLGALSGGFLMDRFGRKIILVAMSIPYVIGWLLIILAVDPSMLYIGRIIGGFAGGVCSVAAPSYIGEISTPDMRGFLGFFFQLMVCAGILVSSLFGLGLDWRWISAISAIDPVIFLVAMIFVPESPYHLLKKGRKTEAVSSLKWLRGAEYNLEPEMALLESRVRIEMAQTSRFSDLFRPWALKPVAVAISLMIFQQFSGINAALFNAVAIFQSAGSSIDPLVSAVLLNVVQLVVTLFSLAFVGRLGRRTLFLISQAVMCLAMVALGTFFFILCDGVDVTQCSPTGLHNAAADSLGWLPLTSLIVFIGAFGLGAGPIPWVMISEIVPAKVKGPGSSVATFTNWFLAFIITKTFVDIQKGLTPAGSFWMFGGFCILAVLFSIFLLPETKGKTPEQIQAFFGIKPPTTTAGQHNDSGAPDKA